MRWWLLGMVVACGPTKDDSDSPWVLPDGDADTDADSDADSDADADADVDTGVLGSAVCARWNADRVDLSEGSWTGSTSSCDAGSWQGAGPDNALRLVNLYRWMADLPSVTVDASRSADAQNCALMMHANGSLSHSPPTSWSCYAASGATGAGRSNIATTPGVAAVDLYMMDPGNSTTIGHRRWILSNSLGPIGLGSTSAYSCMYVLYGNGNAGAAYTAFPSPGAFPIQGTAVGWSSVDQTGWTVQSDGINLNSGAVTVTEDGVPVAVSVATLLGGYGSSTALRITPSGWTSKAGSTYRVQVTGIATPIDYTVDMVDCDSF